MPCEADTGQACRDICGHDTCQVSSSRCYKYAKTALLVDHTFLCAATPRLYLAMGESVLINVIAASGAVSSVFNGQTNQRHPRKRQDVTQVSSKVLTEWDEFWYCFFQMVIRDVFAKFETKAFLTPILCGLLWPWHLTCEADTGQASGDICGHDACQVSSFGGLLSGPPIQVISMYIAVFIHLLSIFRPK